MPFLLEKIVTSTKSDFVGPFEDANDAARHAESKFFNSNWRIRPLALPVPVKIKKPMRRKDDYNDEI